MWPTSSCFKNHEEEESDSEDDDSDVFSDTSDESDSNGLINSDMNEGVNGIREKNNFRKFKICSFKQR